jgi:AAA15 family ATPase/GTPase
MSFKERAELSLIPSKVRRHPDHIIKAETPKGINALKIAVIYGANASGKSNLIKAMRHVQQMVVIGSRSGRKIPFHPYKLEKHTLTTPSRFEFEIKVGEHNYAYGFSADSNEIQEEWLYLIDKVKDKLIFDRKLVNNDHEFSFGDLPFANENDRLFLDFTAKGTPDNRLFLNECKERNVNKELSYLNAIADVTHWFENNLIIMFPNSKYTGLEMDIQNNKKTNDIFSKLLNSFDTGISELKLQKVNFETELIGVPEEIKQKIAEELEENTNLLLAVPPNTRYQFCKESSGEIKAYKLMTVHINDEGEETLFDLNQESDGTLRLLDIAPGLLEIFSRDKTYIIDEIDRSLHPDMTTSIFKAFLNNTSAIKSQLIVTTHETNLLNQKLVRKDEVWFVQKNSNGESSLYSLEEYQPRFDKDIRRGYLVGRFGGIPLLPDFENLSWMKTDG